MARKYARKSIPEPLILFGVMFLLCPFLYGCYWVAKTVSYNVFYEDMVEETIELKVKETCLNVIK